MVYTTVSYFLRIAISPIFHINIFAAGPFVYFDSKSKEKQDSPVKKGGKPYEAGKNLERGLLFLCSCALDPTAAFSRIGATISSLNLSKTSQRRE